jgi:hypothetical protein
MGLAITGPFTAMGRNRHITDIGIIGIAGGFGHRVCRW